MISQKEICNLGLSYDVLIPTHNQLRSRETVLRWRNTFHQMNTVVVGENPIVLNIDESGRIFVHDGHHRLCAAYLERFPIWNLPFKITRYTIADMLDINFECGWVTPYNPIIHVRTHCLHAFKPYIMSLLEIDEQLAVQAIRRNFTIYTQPRQVDCIQKLSERFL